MMIMEELLFNMLRTVEQLVYAVYCEFKDTYDIVGFSITLCSQIDKFTACHIDKRIEHFIVCSIDMMKNMSGDEFNVVKEWLIQSKQIADFHIKEEVSRNWREVKDEKYMFDGRIKEVAAIMSIRMTDIIDWFVKHTVNGKNFRKLCIQVG